MESRNTERLAGYIITLMTAALVAGICWYMRTILVYIVLAAVLALVGRPVYVMITRPSIKGRHIPGWFASAASIALILTLVCGLVTLVIPIVSGIIRNISKADIRDMAQAASVPLRAFNDTVIRIFPDVGSDFRIESLVLDQLNSVLSFSSISGMVGSLASFAASVGIGLFSMVFIAFFFIRDPRLFSRLVLAFVPDRYERKVKESLGEIGSLMSRYFTGLFLEIAGVTLLNFLGLFLIAGMGFRHSVGIAFITGIFNVIPYIGPLVGGLIGVVLSLTIKYVCTASFGAALAFPMFALMLAAVFVFTQMIDNYIFQPLIYSNSIKAHPLEIFIVFLIAGQTGGVLGMLCAIPAYTVARVFAIRMLGHIKAVRMLNGE